jgi:hypothetical protein
LGEEVLERHLFKYKQSVASNYRRSAFLPRMLSHNLSVHILKLRKPDYPSGHKAGETNFFTPSEGHGGILSRDYSSTQIDKGTLIVNNISSIGKADEAK